MNISSITVKKVLTTRNGETHVSPDKYPVVSVVVTDGKREETRYYLKGLEGIFISQIRCLILRELGIIDFA